MRRPDIALAARVLGWRPDIGLDEGLVRAVAYFRRLAGGTASEPAVSALWHGEAD